MRNPFKFGTLVEGKYFADRVRELEYTKQALASENHLILISPRRYGKTSLVNKAALETGRPVLFVNFEAITSKHDLALALLNRLFKLYPFERLKNMLRNSRLIPTLSSNRSPTGAASFYTQSVIIGFRPDGAWMFRMLTRCRSCVAQCRGVLVAFRAMEMHSRF